MPRISWFQCRHMLCIWRSTLRNRWKYHAIAISRKLTKKRCKHKCKHVRERIKPVFCRLNAKFTGAQRNNRFASTILIRPISDPYSLHPRQRITKLLRTTKLNFQLQSRRTPPCDHVWHRARFIHDNLLVAHLYGVYENHGVEMSSMNGVDSFVAFGAAWCTYNVYVQ